MGRLPQTVFFYFSFLGKNLMFLCHHHGGTRTTGAVCSQLCPDLGRIRLSYREGVRIHLDDYD